MLEHHTASFQAEEHMFGARSASPSGPDEHEYHVFEMSTDTDTDSLQDSVTRKRRHAIYFPKPPIWCVRPYPQDSLSMGSSVTSSLMEDCRDGSSDRYESSDSFQDANMFYPLDSDASSKETLPGLSSQASFRQVKPGLCTRLRSYKDIRVGPGEGWAIQEGSLVISLDPSYTVHERHERQPDEFEISNGDVYVICRLYADLWALCVRASLAPLSESNPDDESVSRRLAFIPLCAVTLAANYGTHADVALPPMDLGACKNFASAERDYVPLDSTLEQILCELGSRRDRLRRLRTRLQPQKIWSNLKPWSTFHRPNRAQCIRNEHFSLQIATERLRFMRFDKVRLSLTNKKLKELF
ncbi:uncharacterized protein ACLA_047240 [Aspergillus clavatus NRRL 1]|uniref:Uncharacterized protein n=1 Tax=Aspergillus clavatus (strain ATCC 1007 / CBS 513.65 / DSM 816 / NCTC 3887 / NRRL 1 / QM 1276 / 107) TaxID=344612 RepID=A1CHA0_ASPCL|nr:uncharacterized protein ACLA_047240 [Aspergillus clavatus NRRL 1]EAW10255.1 hypothetical protein ACLA_047240 [Aspergillus clavatus NRRL 1]